MDADYRKPLDIPMLLASQVLLTIVSIPAFVPKPAQVLAFILVGYGVLQMILTQSTGDFNIDFTLGSAAIFQCIAILDFTLLTPLENLRNLHDKDQTEVAKRPFNQRVLFGFRFLTNVRGIGWSHEPSHLPSRPSPSTPRSRFVTSRILLATCCFFLAYRTSLLNVAYADRTTADKLLTGAPLDLRARGVLSYGLGIFCMMFGTHAVVAAGAVGSGLSSPERWPPLLGSPLEVWSIGRFWRRFWHQMIRRCALTCASSILGCIFPAQHVGTTGYKLARLFTVFCISGLAHAGGETMATRKAGFKSITFFMLQPFGIVIELVVSYLWHQLHRNGTKKFGPVLKKHDNDEEGPPPPWIRAIGTIWVMLWMVWTGAYMVDPLYSAFLKVKLYV